MNHTVVPAILTTDIEELRRQVRLVEGAADFVQIDFTDGYFVPEITCCEAPMVQSVSLETPFEVQLMAEEPIDLVEGWVKAGAQRIIGHIEEMTDQEAFVEAVSRSGCAVGLALNVETPVEALDGFLVPNLDVILVMGHEVGVQGSEFDRSALKKIGILRSRYPNIEIEIDGGMTKDTILDAKEAGANTFVVGSAIFGSENPVQSFQDLQELIS